MVQGMADGSRGGVKDIAGLLHDLRNPLTVSALNAELLLDGAAGVLSEDQRKYIGEIYASNKKMLELLNRVPAERE